MKKIIILFAALFVHFGALAHYLWVETNPNGKLNETHEVKVRYGEYTYGAIEKTDSDAFKSVADFSLWLITPNGEKRKLETKIGEDFYRAEFTPTENGNYTLVLNNELIDVLDYTEYDFGIFRPQYHAKANVRISEVSEVLAKTTNPEGIELVNLSDNSFEKDEQVRLQVLFKEKPLAEQEVVIYVSDLWSKTLTTDENGEVIFTLPWAETLYTIETTYNEEIPGEFRGEEYEFVWHCATYAINL